MEYGHHTKKQGHGVYKKIISLLYEKKHKWHKIGDV